MLHPLLRRRHRSIPIVETASIMILRLRRPAHAISLSLALLAVTLVATTTARAHDFPKQHTQR
jgi:hypothetical protein